MNTKLKVLFVLCASALLLTAQAATQNANRPPGTVVSWGSFVIPYVEPGTRFTKLAAGAGHSLALKSDGTVVAWGNNELGQCMAPEGLKGVVSIAAGHLHSVALKDDGTVVAWGSNGEDQSAVPGGLNGVVAIAAGGRQSLAITADRTVVAWGQTYNGTWAASTAPDGLTGVIAIAAGQGHSVALKDDGTVVAWGDSGNGQTTVPGGLNRVIAQGACGYEHMRRLHLFEIHDQDWCPRMIRDAETDYLQFVIAKTIPMRLRSFARSRQFDSDLRLQRFL